MQLLHWLPKFLLRHKIIDFLCSVGLQEHVIKINFNNGSMAMIDLSDPEPRNVFIRGEFEPHFFVIANVLMPQTGIFFDLGANVGLCSFGLVSSRPKARFHLFEANPQMINLLNQSIDLHKIHSFSLKQCCLSDKVGNTSFHLSVKQSGQSHVATSCEQGIVISNLRLDQYCDDHGINHIDFAKIDLEGQEIPALHGWKKSLCQQNIKALYVEIIPENQARYGYETNTSLLILESYGYKLFLCKPEDFEIFGNKVETLTFEGGSISVSSFSAKDYPPSFATDVLAIATQ
jgi:FkbM family methyltransferase